MARIIRRWEQEALHKVGRIPRIMTYDWNALAQDGKVPGVANIFYDRPGQRIFNGSFKDGEVSPTALTLEQIVTAVKLGLSPDFPEGCDGQTCRQKTCPFYWPGLSRCRRLRFDLSQKT